MGRPWRIAVIGGGWAGLAAAIELAGAGCQVAIVDAAPACGGRARGIAAPWQGRLPAVEADSGTGSTPPFSTQPLAFDNGQHLVIGAYTTLLRLLKTLGVAEAAVFARQRFCLDDGLGLRIPGPGLAGLLRASGLSWSLRLSLVKVLAGIALGRERALVRARGRTVLTWSRDQGHPAALLDRFWRPLVISTMNTPVDEACAETFVRVLADSVAGAASASDLLIPHETLSTAFVDPALAWLSAHQASVHHGSDIREICRDTAAPNAPRFRLLVGRDASPLSLADGTTAFDGVVLAAPPGNAARILGRSASLAVASARIAELEAFDYRPISTVYLGWPLAASSKAGAADARLQCLPHMTLLHDDEDRARFGQWLFRRPDQAGWQIASVVISDSARAMALAREDLAAAVSRQLVDSLGLPPAAVYAVFHDRRATIAAVRTRPRLEPDSAGVSGLSLAGDYQYYRYPATLESALRSGTESAHLLLAERNKTRPGG